jgi:DNA replication protein DnaC
MKTPDPTRLDHQLQSLKLPWIRENLEPLASQAAKANWTHPQFLAALLAGELSQRQDRAVARRITQARFPVIKTLEGFDWSWPRVNELEVRDLFRLRFVEERANVVFLGGCGLGKTHLASALGHEACLRGYRVLFTSAAELLNRLLAAKAAHRLDGELKRICRPDLLILDELGYIPIDKHGADLLFQVISRRYEQGAIVLTTNKAFKDWAEIFNHDQTVTSAILDRLLHHVTPITLTGKSYRMGKKANP